jgi:hypothetical protein
MPLPFMMSSNLNCRTGSGSSLAVDSERGALKRCVAVVVKGFKRRR